MAKVKAAYLAVIKLLKVYPALSAALLNIGVTMLAYFGLHLTPDQLVAVVGVVIALFGVIVHSNVKPLAKVEKSVEIVVSNPVTGPAVEAAVKKEISKLAAKRA